MTKSTIRNGTYSMEPFRTIRRAVRGVARRVLEATAPPPPPPPQPTLFAQRAAPFFAVDGDRTLRIEYDLTEQSMVFDLGGYRGEWAAEIFVRYCSTVHVFEAVEEFAAAIERRFRKNPKMHVHPFGLASADSIQSMRRR